MSDRCEHERYVSFESLLMTDRAVKLKGTWLRVHTAGEAPTTFWLEFEGKKTARLAGASLLVTLREKRAAGKINTDHMYNQVVYSWFDQLERGGYLMNKRTEDEDETIEGTGQAGDGVGSEPVVAGSGDGGAVRDGGDHGSEHGEPRGEGADGETAGG